MTLVDVIVKAHRSGEIDLNVTDGSKVARDFGCCASTVSLAKKKLGVRRKVVWERLLDAHHAGKVDLVNWPYSRISKTFGCSHHTIREAVSKGKIKHVTTRGPGYGKIDELAKRDADSTRHYWWRFRKSYGVFKTWGVIPERVGLTKNEWRKKCASI